MPNIKVVRVIPTGDGVSGPYPVVYRLEEDDIEVNRKGNPIEFLTELPEEARGEEKEKVRDAIRDYLKGKE